MLTARAGRLRDWALFAAAALAPAAAVGVLGLRALANEEARARHEVATVLTAAAERASRDVDRGLDRAAEALAVLPIDADPERAGEALHGVVPAFAEPVLLAADRSLLVPAAPRPASHVDPAPPRCRELAALLAQPPPRDEAAAAAARREIDARCEEAKTGSGRFLWPILALEAAGRGEVEGGRVAGWIEAHASILGEAERGATRIEASRALSGPAKERAMRALAVSWSRRDAVAAELAREGAAAALRSRPDGRGLVSFRAGGAAGVLRALPDGRFAGLVIDRGSLEDGLGAGAIALPEGTRALVTSGERAPPDALSGEAVVAPELVIRIVPADPSLVARQASRSRRILAGLGVSAAAIAFGFAALLFARMRAARRSSALRTDFVAAVSHELRTPIASVRMLAELLEEGRVPPDEQREVVDAMAREARRLGETVERLLGFSRMAAGRYVIERAEADLAEVVAASIDTFEERSPELPEVERDLEAGIVARVDAGQIRLAVDNLLANAKKYAPEGTPYRVSVRREGGGAAITVADRGPGIHRRDQRRVFEPFERADDRLSRATEGSGIGLSLVRHVAVAHGGSASVESEPGRGARFTIRVPEARSREP
jgi:signal transduction histidine kinase